MIVHSIHYTPTFYIQPFRIFKNHYKMMTYLLKKINNDKNNTICKTCLPTLNIIIT